MYASTNHLFVRFGYNTEITITMFSSNQIQHEINYSVSFLIYYASWNRSAYNSLCDGNEALVCSPVIYSYSFEITCAAFCN